MIAMSDYLEGKFLDHFLGTASTSAPAAVYLSLHTADPTDAGTGSEVSTSGTAYVRKAITFSAASSGSTSNSGAVEFDTATSSWGTIGWIGVWDASSGGNLLFHGALDASKTIASGDAFKVNASGITLTAA
ncbi:MAG: hypothetical protein VW235_12800 [Rhodospirillaceae bacterium]